MEVWDKAWSPWIQKVATTRLSTHRTFISGIVRYQKRKKEAQTERNNPAMKAGWNSWVWRGLFSALDDRVQCNMFISNLTPGKGRKCSRNWFRGFVGWTGRWELPVASAEQCWRQEELAYLRLTCGNWKLIYCHCHNEISTSIKYKIWLALRRILFADIHKYNKRK